MSTDEDRAVRELLQQAVDAAAAELKPGEHLRGFLLVQLVSDGERQFLRNYGVGHCSGCALKITLLDGAVKAVAGTVAQREETRH